MTMAVTSEFGRNGPPGHSPRYLIPFLFGFAPVALLLWTWDGHTRMPVWFVRTYALPVVAVELATILLAMMEGMRPRLPSEWTIRVALAVFVTVAWGTVLFVADNPAIGALRTALWMIHAAFGLAIAWLVFQRSEFGLSHLVDGILAGFLVFMLLFVIFVRTADPTSVEWINSLPGLGNLRRFGFYATAIIGLCVGASAGRQRRDWWLMPAYAASFWLAFWTGSRGSVAAVLGALLVGLALLPGLRRIRVVAMFVAAAAAGLALTILFGPMSHSVDPSRIVAGDSGAGVDNGRIAVWTAALEAISHRPWFGYGEGQGQALLPQIPGDPVTIVHPHNLLLQLLLAWGVIGTVSLSVLVFFGFRRIAGGLRYDGTRMLPFCVAAIALLAHSMIDGALYNVHPLSIFALCVGAMLGVNTRLGENEATQGQVRPLRR